MPKIISTGVVEPTTDFEWDALSDQDLAQLEGQRASSEREARLQRSKLRAKVARLTAQSTTLIGINLFDVTNRVEPDLLKKLLGGRIDEQRGPVWIDKSDVSETAIVFSCDLLSAAIVCDEIRKHDRQCGDYPTRVYLYKQSWQRVTHEADLSVPLAGGRVILSPKLFPAEVELVEYVPPPSTGPLQFGKPAAGTTDEGGQ